MNWRQFEWVSFDCYGTLIDWGRPVSWITCVHCCARLRLAVIGFSSFFSGVALLFVALRKG